MLQLHQCSFRLLPSCINRRGEYTDRPDEHVKNRREAVLGRERASRERASGSSCRGSLRGCLSSSVNSLHKEEEFLDERLDGSSRGCRRVIPFHRFRNAT